MNEDNLSTSLATLAEDMHTPDIDDIVATARSRIRRRRAVIATCIGTVAVVGVLTGSILAADNHDTVSAAQSPDASSVDTRAQSLDQQLNQAKGLIPSRFGPLGVGFSTTTAGPVPPFINQATGLPLTSSPFAGRSYLLDVLLNDDQVSGDLSITIQHSTFAAPDVIPSCTSFGANCQQSELDDGTRAIVVDSGPNQRMESLRTDGTFIDLTSTGLTSAEVLKFATAFTY
ncbi:MAG TPA: hypothetical protein VHZ97_15950 [Pseudonocardiaceae bacterium]|jgi:hypothetical protein|nr:hypothetical protein [Pseudonocardiaceae bacterium]